MLFANSGPPIGSLCYNGHHLVEWFYLAISQRSEDLKHLIPGTEPTELQG